MNHTLVQFLRTAALSAGLFGSADQAIAQQYGRIGDLYGIGAEGTIGRGTDNLPGGPSTRFGSYLNDAGRRPDTVYYRSGYSRVPAPTAPRPAVAPYLTTFFYTPGDGYRYPLYYNPATRSYFYYPVRR